MDNLFQFYPVKGGCGIKAWWKYVKVEDKAIEQLHAVARLPFVSPHIASMPDAHWGNGTCVGSVIPTLGAIVPASVGVDIGCGMLAVKTDHTRADLVSISLSEMRAAIEKAVPHGRTNNGQEGDVGAWVEVPHDIMDIWLSEFVAKSYTLESEHPQAISKNAAKHLGTLGTGNHFIEVAVDESDAVWVVIHSGSRGFGNKIGSYFTKLAKELCEKWYVSLPDPELAYLPSGIPEYVAYLKALHLAQRYAWRNREIMMVRVLEAIGMGEKDRVNCHHNFCAEEEHFGKKLMITRKGAVRARKEDKVIIPGAMGRATFICAGRGNPNSFQSCSHGAGRALGRKEAERQFTVADHIRETAGLECLKDASVLDETPQAYKPIDDVMASQADLVEILHKLSAVICVKGGK